MSYLLGVTSTKFDCPSCGHSVEVLGDLCKALSIHRTCLNCNATVQLYCDYQWVDELQDEVEFFALEEI